MWKSIKPRHRRDVVPATDNLTHWLIYAQVAIPTRRTFRRSINRYPKIASRAASPKVPPLSPHNLELLYDINRRDMELYYYILELHHRRVRVCLRTNGDAPGKNHGEAGDVPAWATHDVDAILAVPLGPRTARRLVSRRTARRDDGAAISRLFCRGYHGGHHRIASVSGITRRGAPPAPHPSSRPRGR